MAGTDIAALLQELAPALRAVLDRRIELVVDIAPDCPRAACGCDALESLLLQSLRQLLDAMHDSRRIRLSVRADALQPRDGIAMVLDAGGGHVLTHLLSRADRTLPANPAMDAFFSR